MKLTTYYQEKRYEEIFVKNRVKFFYDYRVKLFLRKFPELAIKGKFLDAGCGDGGMIYSFSRYFPKVKYYAADISKKGCNLARRYAIEAKVADFNKAIPYKDNFFDFVFTQEIIEHLVDTDTFVTEMHRVLKPGGQLLLTTPNLLAWYQRILCLLGILPTFSELSTTNRQVGLGFMKHILTNKQPVGHIRVFNNKGLIDILEMYGFEIVSIKGARIKHAMPQPFQTFYSFFDTFFSYIPSLSSNLLVLARKKTKKQRRP